MTVTQTSIEAYYAHKASGKLSAQAQRVLMAIKEIPLASNADVGKAIGIPNSTVSARTKELVENGKIRKAGKKRDPITGMTVGWWEVIA